jgi:hypothetical protein
MEKSRGRALIASPRCKTGERRALQGMRVKLSTSVRNYLNAFFLRTPMNAGCPKRLCTPTFSCAVGGRRRSSASNKTRYRNNGIAYLA